MVCRVAIGACAVLASACAFDESGVFHGSDDALPPHADAAVADSSVVVDAATADAAADAAAVADARADASVPDAMLPTDASTIFRKSITIGGGTVSNDLTNFPLYVVLSDDADLHAHARFDGSDIAFLDEDGVTELDFEAETWNPTTGTLVAWVRVPSLSDVGDTTIYLRYGGPPSSGSNPTGVWQNGFLAVFHLGDNPSLVITDSCGVHDGTAGGGMNASDLVAAKLGNGLQFDGNNDVVNFTNPYQGGGEHTISAWVSQEVSSDNDALVVLGSGGVTDGSRFLHTRFFSGAIAVGLYNDDFETNYDIQGDGFVLVHWTYDASGQSRVYIDGSLVDGPHMHTGPADTQGTEGRLGNAPGGGSGFGNSMGFNGIADEVRLSSTARSPAWIAAEFANQSSPATFYEVGPEQAL